MHVVEQQSKMAAGNDLEKASIYFVLNTSVFMIGWREGSSSIPILFINIYTARKVGLLMFANVGNL